MTTWSLKKTPLVTFALCLLMESFLLLFSFFVIPRTVAHQAPLFMEFTRQDYWIGLPFPSPGDLPNLGIKPGSPALQTDSLQRSLGATVHGITKSWNKQQQRTIRDSLMSYPVFLNDLIHTYVSVYICPC